MTSTALLQRLSTKLRGSLLTVAIVIGVVAYNLATGGFAGTHGQVDDVAEALRSQPGVTSVRELDDAPAPADYALDVNDGAATITFDKSGKRLMMNAQANTVAGNDLMPAIDTASDKAGFDDRD